MALPNISAGTIRSTLGSDIVASLETGLSAAEARVANILSQGATKHMKGRCGPEPLLFAGPCEEPRMRQVLIQPDLYATGRQKLLDALAITPQPVDRERWFSASARWVNVMAAADNLGWTYLDGRMKTSIFASPDADTFAEDTRKRVFEAANARDPWAHKGERRVHIDLAQGLRVSATRGEPDRVMWTAPDDAFEWTKWTDYDDVGAWRDCGGFFGSPCPGYPDGKRYHRTIRTPGNVRVEWWRKKLEVYSKHPLVDLLAYTWGGYSEYLDLNASKLNMTPAQMRAFAEAKTRADFQASQAKLAGAVTGVTALVPGLNIVGGVIAGILLAIGEFLPLASGCQFSFYEYPERVINLFECGAWGEGRTAASTVPKMYGTLLTQGFDPQARLDELNAPPREEPTTTTPAWLVPAAAAVGGIIVGAVIGKVVS